MATIYHRYPVKVNWKGGRDGSGTVAAEHSGVQNPLNVPREFQGLGGGTNPEELLTSAIAACYCITFGIIAANRKIPVVDVTADAEGVVEQNGASFVYRSITVKPRILLSSDATEEQEKLCHEMAHRADGYCIVTNAVRDKVQITIEPEIVRA